MDDDDDAELALKLFSFLSSTFSYYIKLPG